MLDPNSSRTLRIYPLETITRCEVSWDNGFFFSFVVSLDLSAMDLPYGFFIYFFLRYMIHLPWLSGRRALWILSHGVLDCSQTSTLPTHFWTR